MVIFEKAGEGWLLSLRAASDGPPGITGTTAAWARCAWRGRRRGRSSGRPALPHLQARPRDSAASRLRDEEDRRSIDAELPLEQGDRHEIVLDALLVEEIEELAEGQLDR